MSPKKLKIFGSLAVTVCSSIPFTIHTIFVCSTTLQILLVQIWCLTDFRDFCLFQSFCLLSHCLSFLSGRIHASSILIPRSLTSSIFSLVFKEVHLVLLCFPAFFMYSSALFESPISALVYPFDQYVSGGYAYGYDFCSAYCYAYAYCF